MVEKLKTAAESKAIPAGLKSTIQMRWSGYANIFSCGKNKKTIKK